jgi:predicted NBD/HSP70 family sugar kinase
MNSNDTANKDLIKKMNTNAILNVIRDKKSISRADIAKELRLNPATVSNNVTDLLEQGLVIETGSGRSKGGRRPILLEINSENTFVLGVYTEITGVSIGIVNIDGKVIVKKRYRFGEWRKGNSESIVLDTILSGIEDIYSSYPTYKKNLLGIGVGLHGLVDPVNGISIFAPSYQWHNMKIAEIIRDKFNIATFIDNDVRAMALGEKWFGKAKTASSFLLINIGEGVGGAIVTNNELYIGATYGAGEIGHIKVTQKAIQCHCGNYGCLTTVADENGTVERMKDVLTNRLNDISKDWDVNNITIPNIIEMANKGDKLAVQVLLQTGDYIGRAIGAVINILNPERVLLTGQVLESGEPIMKAIIRSAEKDSLLDNYSKTKISRVTIREDLGIIGAATIIVSNVFTTI